jgi:hypothetical protein
MRKLFFAAMLATIFVLVLSIGVGATTVAPCCS